MELSPLNAGPPQPLRGADRDAALREQAEQMEAFLFEELLRVSKVGVPSPAGGGDTHFDSFLRQAQAEAIAASGQIGLAESIYRSMAKPVSSLAAPGEL